MREETNYKVTVIVKDRCEHRILKGCIWDKVKGEEPCSGHLKSKTRTSNQRRMARKKIVILFRF